MVLPLCHLHIKTVHSPGRVSCGIDELRYQMSQTYHQVFAPVLDIRGSEGLPYADRFKPMDKAILVACPEYKYATSNDVVS